MPDISRISGAPFSGVDKMNGVDLCANAVEVNDLSLACATVPESYEMWAGYSTRKLVSGATLCCRVERLNDSTYQDFGFKANGDVNIDAIKTFAGSNPAKVVVWYDQSGNNRNLLEGSSADGPLILNSSGNEIELSSPVNKVGLHFNLTDSQPSPQTERMLEYTGSMSSGVWLLLNVVFQFTSNQGAQNIISQDNSTAADDVGEYLQQTSAKGTTRLNMTLNRDGGGTQIKATNSFAPANNTPYLVTPNVYTGSSHEVKMTVDGTSTNGQGSSSQAFRSDNVLFRVGANAANYQSNQFEGIIGEIIIFSSSDVSDAPSSSERDEIRNDANDYWGVYT